MQVGGLQHKVDAAASTTTSRKGTIGRRATAALAKAIEGMKNLKCSAEEPYGVWVVTRQHSI
ncbi:hypothetical protein [Cellulosilyticum sp. I15G10I2]|uniref:hypothetical protein n=1 Tax=Cellulosilyticum sp. I15G10I2 TaxID=1892843 RepID=UPI00085C639E|nr:hypothetical protein [Cellulosilyticum sp. I15G10I2]